MSEILTEKTILFIDDEERWTDAYVDELRTCGHNVVLKTNVGDALKFFEENCNQIVLLILDIMMSPGSEFTDIETQNGLRTGVRLYEKIREKRQKLYIIILTNVSDLNVQNIFNKEEHCFFYRKPSMFPYELEDQVKALLKNKMDSTKDI